MNARPLINMLLFSISLLFSCETEDPGPLQDDQRTYAIINFDRLEMGSEFVITVTQSEFFSISVEGDRRNLDDLLVHKNGKTLVVRYEDSRNRKHPTHIDITMPDLLSVNFSGASTSTITGFEFEQEFDVQLSGASLLQANITYPVVNVVVSGASTLKLSGDTDHLSGKVSGASQLHSFGFTAGRVSLDVSGASEANVFADDELEITASGASRVIYRGAPSSVNVEATGASSVVAE